jgi:hypothetical protein
MLHLDQFASEANKILYDLIVASVVSKAEPIFSSRLGLFSLWIKSSVVRLIIEHWIIDPVLDDELYSILGSGEDILRSQGKSEFAIKIFLVKGAAIYRWGKCYQSCKYNLTTKKFKKP